MAVRENVCLYEFNAKDLVFLYHAGIGAVRSEETQALVDNMLCSEMFYTICSIPLKEM